MSDSFTSSSGHAPLVSVLMPVRGCRDTLPMAVASVLAQTLEDWELLVVLDDDEGRLEWLHALNDPRVRVMRSDSPGGRGAARQAGLEAARGEFLAFLDADDWMLPDRLARQIDVLNADPELALVSAGMYVLDEDDRPAGVRRLPASAGTRRTAAANIVDAPVLSASSMIRMTVARRSAYDTGFISGEDADFLVRCLRGHRYLQDTTPLYCYREFASFSIQGLRKGLAAERRRRLKHVADPLGRAWCRGKWVGKRAVYEVAIALRGADFVLRRRCVPASSEQVATWEAGRAAVTQALVLLGGAAR